MVRYVQQTVREGEDCGPIDWSHEWAKDMPSIWREAERNPQDFQWLENQAFTPRDIHKIRMWDGWPYWRPMPAALVSAPTGGTEWRFFRGYGVNANTIVRRTALKDGGNE